MSSKDLSLRFLARWETVTWLLDHAVEAEPALADARSKIIEPIEILQTLLDNAQGALGNAPWQAERFRLTLTSTAEYSLDLSSVGQILGELGTDTTQPFPPGVLDYGAVALIGLAAVRLGALAARTQDYLAIVFGLATAAGPAEALARFDGVEADLRAVRLMMANLDPPLSAAPALRERAILNLLTDPVERARWTGLLQLFERLSLSALIGANGHATQAAWLGNDERFAIGGLAPADARPDTRVELAGPFPGWNDDVHVVFANEAGHHQAALEPAPGAQPGDAVHPVAFTQIPLDAEAGWIGIVDTGFLAAVNVDRQRLRDEWGEQLDILIEGLRIEPSRIPDLTPSGLPPWPISRRFHGGRAKVVSFESSSAAAMAGQTVRLSWRTSGAEYVTLDDAVDVPLAATGSQAVTVPAGVDIVTHRLTPHWTTDDGERASGLPIELTIAVTATTFRRAEMRLGPGGIVEVGVPLSIAIELPPTPDGSLIQVVATNGTVVATMEPPHGGGTIDLSVAGMHVQPGVSFTLRLIDGHIDPALGGILSEFELGQPPFSRPVLVIGDVPVAPERAGAGTTRIPIARADVVDAIETGATGIGLVPQILELPWVSDALAVLDEPLAVGHAGLARLVEEIERQAMRSSGLEEAFWVFAVPTVDDEDLLVATTSEATRGIVVCSVSKAGDVAQALLDLDASTMPGELTERLRIVGYLHDNDWLTLDLGRTEMRRVGFGAEVSNGIDAVALSAAGLEVGRRPVTSIQTAFPRQVAALVPTTGAVRVELRRGDEVLATIDRPNGFASFSVDYEPPLVRWKPTISLSSLSIAPNPDLGSAVGGPSPSAPSGPGLSRGPSRGVAVNRAELFNHINVSELVGDRALWSWSKMLRRASTPHVWLEVGVQWDGAGVELEQAFVPVDCPALADREATLDTAKLGAWSHLRLVFSDGWNTRASVPIPNPDDPTDAPRLSIHRRGADAWVTVLHRPGQLSIVPDNVTWTLTIDGEPAPLTDDEGEDGLAVVAHTLTWAGTEGVLQASIELDDDDVGNALTATRNLAPHPECEPVRKRIPVVLFSPLVVVDAPDGATELYEVQRIEDLDARLTAAESIGVAIRPPIALPWADDLLTVLPELPTDPTHEVTDRIIDTLAQRAASTVGLEDALWLVVVPGDEAWSVRVPVAGAAAVAVASAAGLPGLIGDFASEPEPAEQPIRSWFRIVGSIADTGEITISDLRVDERRLGSGDGGQLGIDVVLRSDDDAELARHPLTAWRSEPPSRFAAFVPVVPGVSAIEFHLGDKILRRLIATSGPPVVETTDVDGEAGWQVTHPAGLEVNVVAEAGFRPPGEPDGDLVWVPFRCLPARGPLSAIPQHRTTGADAFRIVALDGWHHTPSEPLDLGDAPTLGLTIRDAGVGWVFSRSVPPTLPSASRWTLLTENGASQFNDDTVNVVHQDGVGTLSLREQVDGEALDVREIGGESLCRPVADQLPLVVLLPSQLEPGEQVAEADVRDALREVEAAHGLRLSPWIELPWVQDRLAILSDPLSSDLDPRIPGLLEQMALRAARTLGAEDALWLMVVPGAARWYVAQPGPGAALFVVATVRGISNMVGQARARLSTVVTRRHPETLLRIVGRIPRRGPPQLHEVREEPARRATADAPEFVDLDVVLLARTGQQISSYPVKAMHRHTPLWFTALVPASPDMEVLELRHGKRVLQRAIRNAGEPSAAALAVHGGQVRWQVEHTYGVRQTVTVELEHDKVWTPVLDVDARGGLAEIPTQRFGAWDQLRLVTNDGWNVADVSQAVPSRATPHLRAVIRSLDRRHFWMETGGSSEELLVTWDTTEITGRGTVSVSGPGDRRLEVPLEAAGKLAAYVTSNDDLPLVRVALDGEPTVIAQSGEWPRWVRAFAVGETDWVFATVDNRVHRTAFAQPASSVARHLTTHRVTALANHGSAIATGTATGAVFVHADDADEIGITLTGHTRAIRRVQWLDAGDRLLTTSDDGSARLWALDWSDEDGLTASSLAVMSNRAAVTACAVVDGATRRIVTGAANGDLRVWDGHGELVPVGDPTRWLVLHGHRGPVDAVASLPDGRSIVSGGRDGTLRWWSLDTGESLGAWPLDAGAIRHLVVVGERVIVGTERGHVTSVALASGSSTAVVTHDGAVTAMALAPGQTRLATGGADGVVRVYELDADATNEAGSWRFEFPIQFLAFAPTDDELTVVQGSRVAHRTIAEDHATALA